MVGEPAAGLGPRRRDRGRGEIAALVDPVRQQPERVRPRLVPVPCPDQVDPFVDLREIPRRSIPAAVANVRVGRDLALEIGEDTGRRIAAEHDLHGFGKLAGQSQQQVERPPAAKVAEPADPQGTRRSLVSRPGTVCERIALDQPVLDELEPAEAGIVHLEMLDLEARRRDHDERALLEQPSLEPPEKSRRGRRAGQAVMNVEALVDQRRLELQAAAHPGRQRQHVEVARIEKVGAPQHVGMAGGAAGAREDARDPVRVVVVAGLAQVEVPPVGWRDLATVRHEARDLASGAAEGGGAPAHRRVAYVVAEEGNVGPAHEARGDRLRPPPPAHRLGKEPQAPGRVHDRERRRRGKAAGASGDGAP